MKILVKILAVWLCLTTVAYAQNNWIRNENAATYYGSEGMIGNKVSVDRYGRMQCVNVGGAGGEAVSTVPLSNATDLNGYGSGVVGWRLITSDTAETSSTTTVINATAHVARVGDAIAFSAGTAGNVNAWSTVSAVTANTITISNALPTTPANGDAFKILRPGPIVASGFDNTSGSALMANIDFNYQASTTTGILKPEDAVHSSGDAGVAVLGVQETTLSSAYTGAAGDYTFTKNNEYGAQYVQVAPALDSTLSTTGITSAGSNNSTNLKAGRGVVYGWSLTNTTATIKYVKLYNKATAPTCGTDAPVLRIGVPATSTVSYSTAIGINMPTGLGYCIVTGAADSDNTAVAANDVFLNLSYR